MAKRTAIPEITGQHVEALTIEVENLKDEVRVLRDVMDEIREDLEWLVRNLRIVDAPRPLQLTSMPLDPTADDFHLRINEISDDDRRQLREQLAASERRSDEGIRDDRQALEARKQRALWNEDETTSQPSA